MRYTEEELLDLVSQWHDGDGMNMSLHKYLGWTWEQYKHWVETSEQP